MAWLSVHLKVCGPREACGSEQLKVGLLLLAMLLAAVCRAAWCHLRWRRLCCGWAGWIHESKQSPFQQCSHNLSADSHARTSWACWAP